MKTKNMAPNLVWKHDTEEQKTQEQVLAMNQLFLGGQHEPWYVVSGICGATLTLKSVFLLLCLFYYKYIRKYILYIIYLMVYLSKKISFFFHQAGHIEPQSGPLLAHGPYV